MPAELPGYQSFDFTHEGTTKKVYWTGDAAHPPIVLMHELPGLIQQCIDLGQRLAAEGYAVFMPLLFGEPNPSPLDFPKYYAQVCIRNEFNMLATRKSSPITEWLRGLCREAKRRCHDQGCGVIGMCLTGGFALTLMADDSVLAPVLSQPSLPLGLTKAQKCDLGVTPDILERSVERSRTDNIPVLAMRFTGDKLCPPERFDEMQRRFGDRFRRIDLDSSIGNPHGHPIWSHSVLTVHYDPTPGSPTRQAYDAVLTFFGQELKHI